MTTPGIRFAVFIPNMAGGGAERSALRVASGLRAEGYKVDLVLASAEGPLMVDVPTDLSVVDLRSRRVLTSLPQLIRYIRRAKPTAMVSVLNHANIVALWARLLARHPMRLVVIEQNNPILAAANASSIRSRLMPRLARWFYPWADAVVGVSSGVVADLEKSLGSVAADSYRVIHNPVVTDDVLEQAKKPVDHSWFDDDIPVLLAVGRLKPQKDFPTLIRAFAKARTNHPGRLIILGEGPERAALEDLADALGVADDVALPGFADNPYPYYAGAAAFVLSSKWEGLPTVVIEALSCGAPVIATDCPSGPREILDDGQYGLLVPTEDVGAMCSAIEAALERRLKPAPDESWQRYRVRTVIDAYLAVLTEDR